MTISIFSFFVELLVNSFTNLTFSFLIIITAFYFCSVFSMFICNFSVSFIIFSGSSLTTWKKICFLFDNIIFITFFDFGIFLSFFLLSFIFSFFFFRSCEHEFYSFKDTSLRFVRFLCILLNINCSITSLFLNIELFFKMSIFCFNIVEWIYYILTFSSSHLNS